MAGFMKLIIALLVLLTAVPTGACFGPKLYLATPAGEDGELLYHLISIYLQEKTGVASIRHEIRADQTAESLLRDEQVDLAIHLSAGSQWPTLLQVGTKMFLLTGSRPTEDLQFTTVPRALKKLQDQLKLEDLVLLRKQVAAAILPATAVRNLFMQRGWL